MVQKNYDDEGSILESFPLEIGYLERMGGDLVGGDKITTSDGLLIGSNQSDEATAAWNLLCEQFPNHEALQEEVIHALPNGLIDAINQNAKDFWTEEEITFERSLTRYSGMGFFLQKPWYSPLLRDPGVEPTDLQAKLEIQQKANAENIRNLIAEDMKSHGASESTISEYFRRETRYEHQAYERRKGYAGWLLTCEQFQNEKRAFNEKWQERIADTKVMPSFPRMGMLEDTRIEETDRDYYTDYIIYFQRWNLETLSTWDLPVPLHSNPVTFSQYNQEVLESACFKLNVPWYLLTDKNLKLHEISDHHINYGSFRHLRPWLDRNDKSTKNWGYSRFAMMFEIYSYLLCGVYKRYPLKSSQMKQVLDKAFTQFYHEGHLSDYQAFTKAESITRCRQELERRLKKCLSADD